MSSASEEVEVTGVEYVGPHLVQPHIYEIILKLKATDSSSGERLRLLFRDTEATILANMLRTNPPESGPEDHVLTDIKYLQT